MKKKLLFILPVLFLFSTVSQAQFTESFTDSNFTAAPKWMGDTSNWIINPALQLQSNDTIANDIFYVSTPSTLATTAQWEFYSRLDFNTSSANYVDVYLTASSSDITQSTTTGYFVRLGNTTDNICLYRKDATGTITKLIDGVAGIFNTSDNIVKVKVVLDATGQWTLLRDLTGTGNSYFTEGVAVDATYNTSSYFGILIKQSTASFFKKHFFDDIVVKPYVPDTTPPSIVSATAISTTAVDILFSEPVDNISSQQVLNYLADNNLGGPSSATQDPTNPALIHLVFANKIPNGTNCTLIVDNVKDLAGNAIATATATFSLYAAQQYDIIIDEIMADPTPVVGLPNNEWIELKNTSAYAINLQGFTIGDSSGQSGPMPAYILPADSFVIVCTGSAVNAMATFGPTIAVTSFPSLLNTGDELILKTAVGKVMHAVNYSSAWYQNALKEQGGWSLEMIDTKNPCTGYSNWKASTDVNGGTPGKVNSIDAKNPDQNPPKLLRAFAKDSVDITLYFDEPLDSIKASIATNYSISGGVGIPQNAVATGPLFDKVNLKLTTPLSSKKTYTITAINITDCSGNIINSNDTAKVGISVAANYFDVVINEILYNPKDNGVDYVELYNRSKKIIDLKQVYIANRNTSGTISNIAQLTSDDYLLFPQNYIVVTSSPSIVKSQYVAQNPDAFVQVNNMPPFNDANGDAIILNAQGNIVDELQYYDSWQFQLLDNTQGVSLERINYDAPTQSQENWHSAATSVGYGTPTYKNSQFRIDQYAAGQISVYPETFSPNNDGIDDFLTIEYSFPETGYVANITIFNASGKAVRVLQQNAICGTDGKFIWDGLGEKGRQLIEGTYVVYTKIFDLSGKTKDFKNAIVLAPTGH
ncbi:MAG TPA: lamin tail domain-containing protein [Ferruginibacter sp.]|nr:lamin tail domain-containing protein [Ferruginibacter sp.]